MKSSLFIVPLLSLSLTLGATKKTGQKKDLSVLLLHKITSSLPQVKLGTEKAKGVLALLSAHATLQNMEINKCMFPFTKELFEKLTELIELSPQEHDLLDKLWIEI